MRVSRKSLCTAGGLASTAQQGAESSYFYQLPSLMTITLVGSGSVGRVTHLSLPTSGWKAWGVINAEQSAASSEAAGPGGRRH